MMSELVYCGQCGHANPETNNYCSKCGSILLTTLEAKNNVHETSENACPRCRKADQIQKLSSIVSAGTRETTGSSVTSGTADLVGREEFYNRERRYRGSGTISGVAHSSSTTLLTAKEESELARRLAAPPKPSEPTLAQPGFGGLGDKIYGAFAIVFCLVGIGLLADGGALMGGVGCVLGLIVGSLVAVAIENLVFREKRREAQTEYDKRMKEFPHKLAAWERASARWDALYYCYRDDIVFVPGEGEYARPEDVIGYCYSSDAK